MTNAVTAITSSAVVMGDRFIYCSLFRYRSTALLCWSDATFVPGTLPQAAATRDT
jgi:hypothetical protein